MRLLIDYSERNQYGDTISRGSISILCTNQIEGEQFFRDHHSDKFQIDYTEIKGE